MTTLTAEQKRAQAWFNMLEPIDASEAMSMLPDGDQIPTVHNNVIIDKPRKDVLDALAGGTRLAPAHIPFAALFRIVAIASDGSPMQIKTEKTSAEKEQAQRDLEDAISGLRGWRSAGESYANRGGRLTQLDSQVDIALDELEWRKGEENGEPTLSVEDGDVRPDAARLEWALKGLEDNLEDSIMGNDLKIVLEALKAPA